MATKKEWTQEQTARLKDAVRTARLRSEIYRANYVKAVKETVGSEYSENGAELPVPVNLLALYVDIVSRHLIANDPRVMLTIPDKRYRWMVDGAEQWANDKIKEMHLAGSLAYCAVSAFYVMGVMMVAPASPAQAELTGYKMRAGQPFAEPVDFDDLVFDVHAKTASHFAFIGHKCRWPLALVQDYNKKLYAAGVKNLVPEVDSPYDEQGEERIGAIGRGSVADDVETEDYVEFWQIYLPRQRLIVAIHPDMEEAVWVEPWVGPACGPYHVLAYGQVPGQPVPLAPLMNLVTLHKFANDQWVKNHDDAYNSKTILPVSGANAKDGATIAELTNGAIFACNDPSAIKELKLRGLTNEGLAWGMKCHELFMQMSGNIPMIGGLAAQSPTATQDAMLNKNSSTMIDSLQGKTVEFTANVIDALLWYWWNHPENRMVSTYRMESDPSEYIPRQVSAADRAQVPYEAIRKQVDPYSMRHRTPEENLEFLMGLVERIVLPGLPVLQQQGIVFDMAKFLQLVGKYRSSPDVEEILSVGGLDPQEMAAMAEQQGGAEQPGMPQQTKRTYERVSRSQKTQGGQANDQIQQLMGGQGQTNGQMPKAG